MGTKRNNTEGKKWGERIFCRKTQVAQIGYRMGDFFFKERKEIGSP